MRRGRRSPGISHTSRPAWLQCSDHLSYPNAQTLADLPNWTLMTVADGHLAFAHPCSCVQANHAVDRSISTAALCSSDGVRGCHRVVPGIGDRPYFRDYTLRALCCSFFL